MHRKRSDVEIKKNYPVWVNYQYDSLMIYFGNEKHSSLLECTFKYFFPSLVSPFSYSSLASKKEKMITLHTHTHTHTKCISRQY